MRILFLNPTGRIGGAENSLLDVIASLRRAAPEWSLGLVVGSDGPLIGRAREFGVDVRALPYPTALAVLGDSAASGSSQLLHKAAHFGALLQAAPSTVRYARLLRSEIARFRPDVIHTNGFKMHILGVRAGAARVPVLWHVRDYVARRLVMARLLRWHDRLVAGILANSMSVAEDAGRICRRTRIHVVYNGIDTDHFRPDGPTLDLDRLANLARPEPGTVRVGLIGTLARWKGHLPFLKAISMVAPSVSVRAYVIGDAVYETTGSQWTLAELRHSAHELGLADRVGFTGFASDVASAARSLDVVVHASTEPEPFGRVIVEGMACGRAVIASSAGGVTETVADAVNGLLHTPGDANALATCITKLASDAELRKKLGAAARITVVERFDRKRLAEQLIPIYRAAALSAEGRAGRPA